jgi:hypothetical protein
MVCEGCADRDGSAGIPSYYGAGKPNWRILRVTSKRAKKSSRARALPAPALVSVVDDDESVRESLPGLLRQLGFAAQAFASAVEFLTSDFRRDSPNAGTLLALGPAAEEFQQRAAKRP